MATLQMFSSFNASNVSFSDVRKNAKGGKAVYLNQVGGGKLIFQLPPLRAPFGLSEYKDEASGRVSYTLPLSLDKPEILEAFSKLDARVLDYITEHPHSTVQFKAMACARRSTRLYKLNDTDEVE